MPHICSSLTYTLESCHHLFLLVDKSLPGASSSGVTRKSKVGLETEFTNILAGCDGKRRCDFTSVVVAAGETGALEENFQENLGVEL